VINDLGLCPSSRLMLGAPIRVHFAGLAFGQQTQSAAQTQPKVPKLRLISVRRECAKTRENIEDSRNRPPSRGRLLSGRSRFDSRRGHWSEYSSRNRRVSLRRRASSWAHPHRLFLARSQERLTAATHIEITHGGRNERGDHELTTFVAAETGDEPR
jgi:hypothetical protein